MSITSFFSYKCPRIGCNTKITVGVNNAERILCPKCQTEMVADLDAQPVAANVRCGNCNAVFGLITSDKCPNCGKFF